MDIALFIKQRSGLGSVNRRLHERKGRIAYLGASVTRQKDGYRPRFHDWLCTQTGHSHQAINACLGGMGILSAVYLMDKLVIRYRPDLCFIEFTSSDAALDQASVDVGPGLEGVIRKLLAAGCVPCILHMHRLDGACGPGSKVRAQYEAIAEHYGVPSIFVCDVMSTALRENQEEEQVWYRDVVHTTPAGADYIAGFLSQALEYLFTISDKNGADLPLCLLPDNHQYTRMVPILLLLNKRSAQSFS